MKPQVSVIKYHLSKMKVTIFLVLLGLASYTYAQSHSISWGVKNPGDRQLFRDIREKKGSFLQVCRFLLHPKF